MSYNRIGMLLNEWIENYSFRITSYNVCYTKLLRGSGISTIVAQHYGAGKKKQIPRIVAVGTAIMTAVSILLTLLVIKTGTFLIAMFGLGPESTAIGGEFFSRIAVFYLLFGIATALRGYLEGLGDVLYSSIAGVISLLFV